MIHSEGIKEDFKTAVHADYRSTVCCMLHVVCKSDSRDFQKVWATICTWEVSMGELSNESS